MSTEVSPKAAPEATKYLVPVVQSTFHILEELAKGNALGLNEITNRTKISKSTVFRILTTLTHLGYVARDGNRNYYSSRALSTLISEDAGTEALRRSALPQMFALRDLYGETVNLGQLEFDRVIYSEVVPSEFALRLHERPGASVPVHASALGKVILAFSAENHAQSLLQGRALSAITRNTITNANDLLADLKKIRTMGYAFDRGEISLLATCVAVPILNTEGAAIAAISISGPTSRFNPRKGSPVIEKLRQAAESISKQLRTRQEPEPRKERTSTRSRFD